MRNYIYAPIIKKAVALEVGVPQQVLDFRNVDLIIAAEGADAAFTVQIQVSKQPTLPDFSLPATIDNDWAYCQAKALIDGQTLNGNSGVVITGPGVVHIEVNENAIFWVNAEITSYTSGTCDVRLLAVDYAI